MKLSFDDVEEIRFTVVKGTNPGARIPFSPGARSIRIGRAVDSDIVIGDPTVSRNHVRVDVQEEGCRIADAGSRSGVEKMGFRVGTDPEPLESGDEIRLGETILRFEVVLKKAAAKRATKPAEAEAEGKAKKKAFDPKEVVAIFQRSLAIIGLKTPSMQIIAAAIFAAILVLALWPEPPGLPPQATGSPLPVNYDAAIGFVDGGDQAHLDGAIFELPNDAEGVVVYFKTAAPAGVGILVGDKRVTTLEGSPEWEEMMVLTLPRAISREGAPHLILDHLGYSASDGNVDPATVKRWMVGRMWLARVPQAAALPARLEQEIRALRDVYDHLEDEIGNLYRLLTGLRATAIGFMKLSGRPAAAIRIPSAGAGGSPAVDLEAGAAAAAAGQIAPALDAMLRALGWVEGEVARKYRERMNTLRLLEKRGASEDRGRLLAVLSREIPEPTDPRHRAIRDEVDRLDGPGRMAYDKTMAAVLEGSVDH